MKKIKKYKVELTKKYYFELDGKSESNVREQVDYIMNNTSLLENEFIKKRIRMKIKNINANTKESKTNDK